MNSGKVPDPGVDGWRDIPALDAFTWKLHLEPPFLPSYPVHRKCVQDVVGRAIRKRLSAKEAGVIRRRFGLYDGREWTCEEIGRELQVTRERVRQIQERAFRRLRRELLRHPEALGIEVRTIALKQRQMVRQAIPKPAPCLFYGVPYEKLTAEQKIEVQVAITQAAIDKKRREIALQNPHWACKFCCKIPCVCP